MEDLQKQLDALQEEAKVNAAKIAALEVHITTKDEELSAANKTIKELAESSVSIGSLSDAKPAAVVTVTFQKKKYLISAPRFKYKGKAYTAQEAADDKELFKELLELKVGFISEQK